MHEMRLKNEPFNLIKNGIKTIELRLYDEKRQKVKIGDIIEFTNLLNGEKIKVRVINLHLFKNFHDLVNSFDKKIMGFNEEDDETKMLKYYSEEEQKMYGVVGIEIKLLKGDE